MKIHIGRMVKDMKYPQEKIYKLVGISRHCVIRIVVLKTIHCEIGDCKTLHMTLSEFNKRFQYLKKNSNERNSNEYL